MKTIGAIPKEEVELIKVTTFRDDDKEDKVIKGLIDLKEVEPNNSFYDKPSKEKEPISKPTQKVKKKK